MKLRGYEQTGIHFHSLLAETERGGPIHRFREFVIFDGKFTYPEFLLAYKRTSRRESLPMDGSELEPEVETSLNFGFDLETSAAAAGRRPRPQQQQFQQQIAAAAAAAAADAAGRRPQPQQQQQTAKAAAAAAADESPRRTSAFSKLKKMATKANGGERGGCLGPQEVMKEC